MHIYTAISCKYTAYTHKNMHNTCINHSFYALHIHCTRALPPAAWLWYGGNILYRFYTGTANLRFTTELLHKSRSSCLPCCKGRKKIVSISGRDCQLSTIYHKINKNNENKLQPLPTKPCAAGFMRRMNFRRQGGLQADGGRVHSST